MKREPKISASPEETQEMGRILGRSLKLNAIVALFGDLGAGKTTFIKGVVEGIGGYSADEVCSPTFTYLNIYPAGLAVYHFDLYRLRNKEDFSSLGFEEHFNAGGICLIEWSEKIAEILPQRTLQVHLSHQGDDRRLIL